MSANSDGLRQALVDEQARISEEIGGLEEQISTMNYRLEQLLKRSEHVSALLENEGGATTDEPVPETQRRAAAPAASPSAFFSRSRKNSVELAYSILKDQGRKPMHYKDLALRIVDQGGDLDPASAAQTLVARLSKDKRFIRPQKRGWYSLKELYPHSKSVGTRRKNAGAKRASKTSGRSTVATGGQGK